MKPSIYPIEIHVTGQLFIMPKPSGEWLADDIAYYRTNGVTDILSLLRPDEIKELELSREALECANAGLSFQNLPIKDRGLPKISDLKNLVKTSASEIIAGACIAVHCRAGIGRAGLLTCCILQELGIDAEQSLNLVSEARGVRVPDTNEQKDFILNYLSF